MSNVSITTYFYAWYDASGRHWNDSPLTPVIDKPLVGFYSSDDDSVIEWQLRLIKDARIDALFISW